MRAISLLAAARALTGGIEVSSVDEHTDHLAKARPHKYIRREPKAGGGWKYYYSESSAARTATEGTELKLGDKRVKVAKVTDDGVELEGGEKLTHAEWLDKLSEHYTGLTAHAEKRARIYARAVLRAVPTDLLGELQGTDAERLAQIEKKAPEVYAKLQRGIERSGMSGADARRAIAWTLSRRGWQPEARAALIGEMSIGPRAAWVQANYEKVGKRAEQKAARGMGVAPQWVSEAVDELAPKSPKAAPKGADAKPGDAKPAERPHAELLAEALADQFPGMKLDDLVRLVRAAQAKDTAAKAPAPAPKTEGANAAVYLPGANGRPEKLPAKFKLVEAEDLVASHDPKGFTPRKDYPAGLQERAYHRDKAEQQKVVRNAEGLIPEYVANTNPDAVNGTPLVDDKGVVLGGNSRTMSMQLAYQNGKGDELKAYLAENAAQFGLTAGDVKALKNPVLVRVVDTQGKDPKLLVRQMNEAMTQDMDPRVMQVAMGRRLDEEALGSLAADMQPDETLSEFLDSRRSEGFMQHLRRAGIIDARNASRYLKDGKLNADGKQLVERVLVGKVVADPDLLSDTNPSVVTALAQAVPYMVQAEAHGAGYNLRDDMRQALTAHNDMQRRGVAPKSAKDAARSVDEYLRTLTMGTGDTLRAEVHPLADNDRGRALLTTLFTKTGPRQMASVFRAYAAQAEQNPEGQASLFGPAATPAEVFQQATELAKALAFDEVVYPVDPLAERAAELLVKAMMLPAGVDPTNTGGLGKLRSAAPVIQAAGRQAELNDLGSEYGRNARRENQLDQRLVTLYDESAAATGLQSPFRDGRALLDAMRARFAQGAQ